MKNTGLTVVIPAFRHRQQIKRCLQALEQSDTTGFDIVVVDHGITEEISQWIKIDFPAVTCLRGSSDLWWTGATNLGIKYALKMGSRLIMPLNHDCYVRENTIANLLKSSGQAIDSIVAPIQYSLLKKKQQVCATSCFLLGFPTIIFPARWCKVFSSGNLLPTGLIIGGRGAVIDAEIFNRVGYFDELALPHYGADHDFYLRCKKSGIKLLTCLDAIVDIDDSETGRSHSQKGTQHYDFVQSLVQKNSRQNIRDTYAIFSRHYPVPGFAFLGLALYLMRYSVVSLLKFTWRTIQHR